ncbi:MAG: PhnD/SsuA/transferrin family substrate-binding protein [Burkholderiales bacterium]|nr:PhnD/SsuA/transferrin family substrate-binding protein [Burkholderiales bacterium]
MDLFDLGRPVLRPSPARRRSALALARLPAMALVTASRAVRAQEGGVYRFSPVNQYGIELTAKYWNPIIEYVSAQSGVKLQLKIGRTSADTTAYVLANEVEFLFSNHLFSPERDHLGWKVFGRRQTPPIHSQIVVLASSPIRKLEELADQPVAFPGPEALVAYKFSYAQLLKRNIPVQVLFGGNMDGAFAQLASGKAKAVGANSQLTEGWSRRENQTVRVLWQSEPLHDLALMAARKVPEKELQAVTRAFLDMNRTPEGQKILAAAAELVKLPAGTAFIASNGSEYSAYRNFYQSAPASLR